MKKEKEEKNLFQKLQETPQGKAILKLAGWLFFFVVLGVLFLTLGERREIKQEPTIPSNTSEDYFLPLSSMLRDLELADFSYEYQIIQKDTNDSILYHGSRVSNIDTGYRESKIGIIKYKIKEEKIYQVLVDQEIEIDNLYEEDDIPIFNIDMLIDNILALKQTEETYDNIRKISLQDENTTYLITTDKQKITMIQISNITKDYYLKYEIITEEKE